MAAIVHANCSSCHRPDGPAPFPLLTHGDAAAVAPLIADAVASHRMPPWLPADDGPAFEGERRLTEREIRTLVAWAEAGAPRGDSLAEPAPPAWPSGWALGDPDLVLSMDSAYALPAAFDDRFRNFVLRVDVDGSRWVRAVELRPTNPAVVHHATMRVDPSAGSRLADARDPGPGFDDMFAHGEARIPGAFFLGWTPGRIPTPNPEGMAWRLEPGSDFVVQLHLRATGRPETIAANVGLWFSDEPPRVQPLMLRLNGHTMDIPPGDTAYVVTDSMRVPVAVRAIGAYPHAHYLAKTMHVWAELPGGERRTLMRIPRWDFNWQDAYRYAEPVEIPAGSVLRMRYVYDNSAANPFNPSLPPKRVVFGPDSDDEMAEFWLQVVPAEGANVRALAEAIVTKEQRDRLAAARHLASLDPSDADAQFRIGAAAQAAGDLEEALRRYRLALAAAPGLAQAHFNIGLIRERRGAMAAAQEAYEAAVAASPEYAPAWNNLGRLRAAGGDLRGAAAALARAVAADPSNVEALNNLGGVLRELGRPADAEPHLRRAVTLRPEYPAAWFNLAFTLVALGHAEEGVDALNRGLGRDPGNAQAALAIIWELATHPSPEVRRPELAVRLAEELHGSTGPHAVVSDVLATAYAAAGRFDRARALVQEAAAEARRTGSDRLREIEQRAALFARGRPFVRNGR